MFRILTCLLLASSLGVSPTPQEIVRNFRAKISSLESLEASFSHTLYSMTSATPREEKGKFFMKRPEMMRWEYLEPEADRRIYVYRDGLLLSYFAEDNQLIRQPVDKDAAESDILEILTGQSDLEKGYVIEKSPFPTDDPEAWQIKLTPRIEGETSHLLLEIDRKTWLLRKVILFDWAGDKQAFQFSKVKVNPRLGKDVFEIKTPCDCEIIDQTPSRIKKTLGRRSGIPENHFPPVAYEQ